MTRRPVPCPPPDLLRSYLLGTLPFAAAREWDEHVLNCQACTELAGQWETDGELQGDVDTSVARQSAESTRQIPVSILPFLQKHAPPVTSSGNGQKAPLHPGTSIGDYQLAELIGQGGMGIVFRAVHARTNQVVALKVIRPEHLDTLEATRRFRRETEVITRLQHPRIVKALDAGEADGVHFLVMEYMPGGNLSDAVRHNGALPLDQAINYVLQAAEGLQYAHEQGVVHRDINPHNLLIDASGFLKIADLGLARVDEHHANRTTLTSRSVVMGTVDYLSPEQALDSGDADARSDIYAHGCTLHYLLTARPVYGQPTTMKALVAHREAAIPSLREQRPDVPVALDRVFQKMIAKRPADRFESMRQMSRAIQAALSGDVATEAPSGRGASQRSAARRHWVKLLCGLALLIAIGTWALSSARRRPGLGQQSAAEPVENQAILSNSESEKLQPPPAAVAPFDAEMAKRSQIQWAEYLGAPLEIVNSANMRMTLIPPGTFQMGMTDEDVAEILRADAEYGRTASSGAAQYMPFIPAASTEYLTSQPAHPVTISRPFYLGTCEVTRAQYARFVRETGYSTEMERELNLPNPVTPDDRKISGYQLRNWMQCGTNCPTDQHPAVFLAWNDAVAFCDWLSAKEGVVYRLPTEAEWEYACRAGTTTLWSSGNRLEELYRIGNVADGIKLTDAPAAGRISQAFGFADFYFPDGFCTAAPVGQYPANSFGLYDMHGNATEWCLDQAHSAPYPAHAETDPRGMGNAAERVYRGGGWARRPRMTLSGFRTHESLHVHYGETGFRLLREISKLEPKAYLGTPAAPRQSPALELSPADADVFQAKPPDISNDLTLDAVSGRKLQLAWARHLNVQPQISSRHFYLFNLIPPGRSRMGLTAGDQRRLEKIVGQTAAAKVEAPVGDSLNVAIPEAREARQPDRIAEVVRPFYLGLREVTRGQFRLFVQETGFKTEAERRNADGKKSGTWLMPYEVKFGFPPAESHPVVNVSYDDAVQYCKWLSRRENLRCRLPSEDEWEHACRAGTTTLWSHGDDLALLPEFANVADAIPERKAPVRRVVQVYGKPDWYFPDGYPLTSPAGLFKSNALGLYDMHGNVREWCSDSTAAESQPKAAAGSSSNTHTGKRHVLRGGSWWTRAERSLSSSRSLASEDYFSPDVGFRIVLEIPKPAAVAPNSKGH